MPTKVESNFIAASCNRLSSCLKVSTNGIIAYGSHNFVALTVFGSPKGVLRTLNGPHSKRINVIEFVSYQGILIGLLSACADGYVAFWSLKESVESRTCSTNIGPFCEAEDMIMRFEFAASFRAHEVSVECLLSGEIFSDDEVNFFSSGSDKLLKKWVLKQKKEFICLQSVHSKHHVTSLAFRHLPPETYVKGTCISSIIALATTDNRIALHNSHDLSVSLLSLEGHANWIKSLDFGLFEGQSSDNYELLLASASMDKYVRIWKLEFQPFGLAGKMVSLLIGHDNWVYSAEFNPAVEYSKTLSCYVNRVRQVLSSSSDGSMLLWSPTTFADSCSDSQSTAWASIAVLGELSDSFGFYGCRFVHSNLIVGSSHTGSLQFWAFDEGPGVWGNEWTLTGHFGPVEDICWSSDQGEYFVSCGGSDQTTRIFSKLDRIGWKEIARPQIHGYDITCLAMRRISHSSTDDITSFRLYSGADEKVVRVFEPTVTFIESLGKILSWSDDKRKSLRQMLTVESANLPSLGLTNKLSASSNTDQVAASCCPTTFSENYLSRGTLWPELEKLYGHPFEISAIAVHPSLPLLVAACKASQPCFAVIKGWCTDSWKPVVIDPVASESEASQPRQVHSLTITKLAFSPDGKFLVSASRDRSIALYKVSSGGDGLCAVELLIHVKSAHTRIIWDVKFSPCSEYVASGSRDKKVKIWKINHKDGHFMDLQCSHEFAEAVHCVSFLPHVAEASLYLSVGLDNGHIYIMHYDVRTKALSVEKLPDICLPSLSILSMTAIKDLHTFHLLIGSEDHSLRLVSFSVA